MWNIKKVNIPNDNQVEPQTLFQNPKFLVLNFFDISSGSQFEIYNIFTSNTGLLGSWNLIITCVEWTTASGVYPPDWP